MATKKKYAKELRRIQSELPVIERNTFGAEIVPGALLIARGETKVDGKPIDPEKKYRTHYDAGKKPISHARNMKKMFKKHGLQGVQGYINAVHNHVTKPQTVN